MFSKTVSFQIKSNTWSRQFNPKLSFRIKNLDGLRLPSVWALILTNIISAAVGIENGWRAIEFIFLYWIQSIIIGLFQFLKILDLKDFSTKGLTINGQPALPTPQTKRFIALFFALHYGLFHLAYLMALLGSSQWLQWQLIWPLGIMFFLNHLFSYLTNRSSDRKRRPNIGRLMFFPYLRIIPMHLTIILGAAVLQKNPDDLILLIFFLALKIITDLAMHLVEHTSGK